MFIISLEDDLFIKYRIHELIPRRYIVIGNDGRIENPYVTNEVNRLQRIIEGQNGDIKYTLGKYSEIIEQQRKIVAAYRREILTADAVPEPFRTSSRKTFDCLTIRIGVKNLSTLCRWLLLAALDFTWSSYLADMADLRDGIHFRRFGRLDPLFEFNSMAIDRFAAVIGEAQSDAAREFDAFQVDASDHFLHALRERNNPSATWTYLVSDNPFEDDPDLQMSGDMGYSIFAGLLWPVTTLMLMMKRKKRREDSKQ